MLEEVKRLKKANKEGMEKQEDLMASAKVLQGRINSQNKVKYIKCLNIFFNSHISLCVAYCSIQYNLLLLCLAKRFIFDFLFRYLSVSRKI